MKTSRLFKELLRGIEGTLEVIMLSLAYYFSFRNFYASGLFSEYLGRGKYLLLLVYALLVCALFFLNQCFLYGRLKLSHISVTQTIDILIVNIITYFQLCLIANRVVSLTPIIIQSIIDTLACFVMCYLFTYLYQRFRSFVWHEEFSKTSVKTGLRSCYIHTIRMYAGTVVVVVE